MATTDELHRRITRGIELLEDSFGPSWVELIDLDRLNLASQSQCVLGQVYGHYSTGTSQLGLNLNLHAQHQHGFNLVDDVTGFELQCISPEFDELTEAWASRIAELKEVAR